MDKIEKNDNRIRVMSEEKPAKAVVKMGVPLIASMMIMVLYNLTDTYFIGLLHDDYQLAAVNLAYPVMMVSMAISNMIGTGASSLIARSLGAGDKELADHTLTAGFLLTGINSLVVMTAGLFFLNPLINGLGAKSRTFLYTRQYVMILLIGSFFTMGSYTFGQLLRSEGSVKQSVTGMMAGTVTNMILGSVMILGMGLSIRGAALATMIGNAVSVLISGWFYLRKKAILRPKWKYWKPTKMILKEIFWVGVPASLETMLTSAAFIVNNHLAVSYGELTVAAMGIAQKILTLGSYVYQGFAAGIQPMMGYNYGAGNYRRMLKLLKAGVLIVSGTELCLMAVYGFLATPLIGIFTESGEVIAIGAGVLRRIMWILPFVGAVSMSRMSFQAMGKPQHAFVITLIRQVVLYIPLLWLFNHLFGFKGMLWAQPVTEFVMMLVSLRMLAGMINGNLRKKTA